MSVSSIASVTRVPLLFVTAHACSVAGGEAGATTGARSGDEDMTMPQRTAIRPGVPGVPMQRPMGHRPMAAAVARPVPAAHPAAMPVGHRPAVPAPRAAVTFL